MTAPFITITRERRVYVFAVDTGVARPVRVFDDHGKGGTTEYMPPEEWIPEAVQREADEEFAAVWEPRRKRLNHGNNEDRVD